MMVKLSRRMRQVVELVGRDGLSYDEVGEELGIATATVQQYISRAAARIGTDKRPRDAAAEYYWSEIHPTLPETAATGD